MTNVIWCPGWGPEAEKDIKEKLRTFQIKCGL